MEQFGPFFLVRKSDGAAIGEIGSALNVADDPGGGRIVGHVQAGMRESGRRQAEEAGQTVELVADEIIR